MFSQAASIIISCVDWEGKWHDSYCQGAKRDAQEAPSWVAIEDQRQPPPRWRGGYNLAGLQVSAVPLSLSGVRNYRTKV
jgi:hypothetical protein